ncbi:glycosyltransferase family 4 protein [Thermomonas carbonis]|uniref:Glycosyltransferase n=1 Tax=Thermomonas carbonis TaxID=1463158 RepID=A0A7G9SMR2_9GAMM|nr:glycosyltransferase [Thermomonas carbonis]QNN69137.1 glycosyltransferase [Thermomonas carbonis]GHC06513.1 hypothetical protein GCM10010080_20810 [Thermomonas carbonis]
MIAAATTWTVNGVNVFSANLVRGLLEANVSAQVLLTEHDSRLINTDEALMPRPDGVPFQELPVGYSQGWGAHWGHMVRLLEEAAPCIYIPNSDWRHSMVCPRLSENVVVVGVVHSDDPLHYDHVQRLGRYWNVIVAVSGAVARRVAELCPELADRIITIPIGVNIPPSRPVRNRSAGVLRLIYHGVLKQHQKRVLDLPKIVQHALDLGVPVELSIVGAGPDEAALRDACNTLVERGAVRFLGVVSPDSVATLLEQHDVYLLASAFEGMPNALIEAMGRGCVPVVSRMESGIPELVDDGINGFMVSVGDTIAFAERLQFLWQHPERREQMAAHAHETAHGGGFRVEDMVAAYRRVFADGWQAVREGRFIRTREALSPPPREVAGISLFPVELTHHEGGLGDFPSVDDCEAYILAVAGTAKVASSEQGRRRQRVSARRPARTLEGLPVFVSAPAWTCNGVNRWSEDLVRGLRKSGLSARILLTEESTGLVHIDEPRLGRASDIPFQELMLSGQENWGARWGAMIRTLEAAAPCIYIPNYDWRHSSVIPALSDRVKVIGMVHEASALYTEHVAGLRDCWDAVVTTDLGLSRHLRQQIPGIEDRLEMIENGLDFLVPRLERAWAVDAGVGVSIVILGAGLQHGEHGWLPRMFSAIATCMPGSRIVVIDPTKACQPELLAMGAQIVIEPNRQQWLALCRGNDFVVAGPGNTELRPLVLEAMGNGCIPLWIGPSPPSDWLIIDGSSGLVAADGNVHIAARQLRSLIEDPMRRREMASCAHRMVRKASTRTEQMIDRYLDLFVRLMLDPEARGFRRLPGPIRPPPPRVAGCSIFPVDLPTSTAFGRFPSAQDARRFVKEAGSWNRLA